MTVETDDSGGEGKGSAIGPEGKTTLRARFVLVTVAGSCADRPNGSGDGGNSFPVRDLGVSPPAQNRPHFVLLRVSAVEDDAMLLLGRWVSLRAVGASKSSGLGAIRRTPRCWRGEEIDPVQS